MRRISGLLIGVATLLLLACQSQPADRLQYGIHETADRSIVWVSIDGELCFALATEPVEEIIEENENWEGTEFNVFYTLLLDGRRAPVLVYGDVNEGIITGSFRNDPLDLEKGTFLVERGGRLVGMTQAERDAWLAELG